MPIKRRYPIGAEIIPKRGVHFRLWAHSHSKVNLILENPKKRKSLAMKQEKNGYFSLLVPEAKEGSLYRFQLGNSEQLLADPASRFQPTGPFGSSAVVNPKYPWTDKEWAGAGLEGSVMYEMHIGTFTPEGTFRAAMKHLDELASLGINVIELMPLNEFPGHFGWGYDGVNLYAPKHTYGTPNDVKAFINKAHNLGIGVVLDVVYNHFGPDGNQVIQFSPDYLTDKFHTDWGKAINYDNDSVREFFLTNGKYWIEEFHFDGLRVDAIWCIYCSRNPSFLAELSRTVKNAGGKRKTILVGEDESQQVRHLKSVEDGGTGFDALWNDDFHHTAFVALTGKREAYYTDYLGSPQEFISAIKYGFLYQGQYYLWQSKNRGTPNLNLPRASMVIFLENHDQIANSGSGRRLIERCDFGEYKSLTCLLLLGPNTPLLFQGQEFGSTKPFFYFADHSEDLNALIAKGRREALAQFPRLSTKEAMKALKDPGDPSTFTSCKLDFHEKDENKEIFILYRDLLKLRKDDPVFSQMQKKRIKIDGAVLGANIFLLRYFGEDLGDRLLVVNLGIDHYFIPAPEPLLVAGEDAEWSVLWSSESVIYGGEGTPSIKMPKWKILGHSAIVLKSNKK